MATRKSFRNDVWHDSESIATKVWSQVGRKWNSMQVFDSHVVTSTDRTSFVFFEQSAFVNNHLLCYWPTVHNSISKSCPKFQVLSSHFSKVDELLDEHWAKIVRSENISTPIACIEKRFAFKNSAISCLALIIRLDIQLEQSENDNDWTILYANNRFEVARCDETYTVFFDRNSWLSD